MRKTFHQKTTVKPGGRIEITNPHLQPGQTVEITIRTTPPDAQRRSEVDILGIINGGPERRLFQTPEEVKEYLNEEKTSWER